jgi:hypothetical protein
VTRFSFSSRRVALALLVVGMLAALAVSLHRARYEHHARRVEIAMDYLDFSTLARSYGYDETQFLIALRRAGLTSLAVPEELGSAINSSGSAQLLAASDVANAYGLGTLHEPALLALARAGQLGTGAYLIVTDESKVPRYRTALGRHLGPHAVKVIQAHKPAILQIKSQIDYLNTLGFGIPEEPLAIARAAKLHLIPRLQNDPKYDKAEIDAILGDFTPAEHVNTVIFFGQRSEVLGFPNHLEDTAAAFNANGYTFGSIETYDPKQIQKGNDGLAKLIIGRTTRVQAISKTEQDQLDFEPIVARYLLGVRERNVRVVYLRPFTRAIAGETFTPEGANLQLVSRIADGVRARGYTLGPATPIEDFHTPLIALLLVALAVPAFFALLLDDLGVEAPLWALCAYVFTVLILLGGVVTHHDLLGRKIIALAGAILFATGAIVAVRRSFVSPVPATFGAAALAGLRTAGIALGVALGGAAIVVGLCSSALLMEEIDRFSGVKAVIVVPPILAAAIVLLSRGFGGSIASGTRSLSSPVRAYQLGLVALLGAGALLYIMRSGNQSDIAPSSFELALRSHLTAYLGVRPRFKEFVVGFPLLMLLPSLPLAFRQSFGWLLAAGIAIGTADVVDTFSHLHTPLIVSLLRVFNGAILGCLIGLAAIAIYRAVAGRVSPSPAGTGRMAKAA